MTSPKPSVNLPLMLRDHLPDAIREKKASIAAGEQKVKDDRAELEVLIRLAAVMGVAEEMPEPAVEAAP